MATRTGAWCHSGSVVSGFSGAVVRLREDGGDTEQDFKYVGGVLVTDDVSEDTVADWLTANSATNAYLVTTYDQSGNSANGTTAGTPQQPLFVSDTNSSGKWAAEYDETGSNDEITFGATPVPTLSSPWAMSIWVEGIGANHYSWIISSGTEWVGLSTTSGNTKIATNGESPGTGAAWPIGWNNLILEWDGTDLSIYVNATLDYSVTPSGSGWQTATVFNIGDNPNLSPFDGRWDNCQFFSGVLTSSEKTDLAVSRVATLTESDPPTVSTLSPSDDATGVSTASDLVVTFNEDVQVGTGNIELRLTSDDSVVEQIDVTSGQVSVSGAEVTITITGNMEFDTGYYVLIDATAIDDLAGNSFAGISTKTTWNFTTGSEGAGTVLFLGGMNGGFA